MVWKPGPLADTQQLADLIEELRGLDTDHQRVEAKRSRSDIPRELWKAMSAFSNAQGGGTILLGVDEKSGFAVTGVENVSVIQDKVRSAAAALTPHPSLSIQAHHLHGKAVVEIFVPEMPDTDKPCYHAKTGKQLGSCKRVGDSNAVMDDAELRALDLLKAPARYDEEAVDGSSAEDLDAELVAAFLAKRRSDHAQYASMDDARVLERSRVLAKDGRVTVAGLIAMGHEPGYFHPGLRVQFVVWATDRLGASDETGLRYVDNPPMLDGPLLRVYAQLMARLRANLRNGSRIDSYRVDVREYPDVALREAVINALVHRELHPTALNSHVTVSVFPNRIEIINPGGLYQVGFDEIGRPIGRSSRNARLMEILEHLPLGDGGRMVVENRGGGIPAIVEELRVAGLHQPRFTNRIYQFELEFPRGSLVARETLSWLAAEAPPELTISQRLGAATLHQGEVLTNESYRRLTGVDSAVATRELAGLVALDLAEADGDKGGRKYRLHAEHHASSPHSRGPDEGKPEGNDGISPRALAIDARRERVVALLNEDSSMTASALAAHLGVSVATIERDISALRQSGRIARRRPGPKPS